MCDSRLVPAGTARRGQSAAETPGHLDGIDVHGRAGTPTKIKNFSSTLYAFPALRRAASVAGARWDVCADHIAGRVDD
jgi:hypothetical protein